MSGSIEYVWLASPVGRLLLAACEAGLCHLSFEEGRHDVQPQPGWREDDRRLGEVIRQLNDYFAGTLRQFDVPLAPQGTVFQRRVWEELCRIPYGETISYAQLAHRVRNPRASRAVGLANGANPIAIIVPCHRVIGSDGTLTGYGGGLRNKQWLLAHERAHVAPLFATMRA